MQMWYMYVCVCSKLAKNYPTPLLHSLFLLLFFLRSPHCPYNCDSTVSTYSSSSAHPTAPTAVTHLPALLL